MMKNSNLRLTRMITCRTKGGSTLTVGLAVAISSVALTSAQADEPIKIAVLSAQSQNDHAEWVPTTDAERQRLMKERINSGQIAGVHQTFAGQTAGYRLAVEFNGDLGFVPSK